MSDQERRSEDGSPYSPDLLAAIEALERAERFREIEGAYALAFREYKRRLPHHFAYIAHLILLCFPLVVAWQYHADTTNLDLLMKALISGAIIGVVMLVGQLSWRPSWARLRLIRAVGKWKGSPMPMPWRRARGSHAT